MVRRFLLPLCIALVACAAPADGADDDAAIGATRSAIVGGTPSTAAQDATVYISIGTDGHYCSGTLIAPNLVITARHCVQGTDENATTECAAFTTPFVASTLTISLGATANGTAPVATGKQTFVDTGDNMCSHDIGLILLDRDVPGAKVATVRFDKLAAGEITSTVGYGDDGTGTPTNGRYQRGSLKVDFVGPASASYTTKTNQKMPYIVHPGEIATGESTCFGDSGGPLLDSMGSIVGMTSRGIDEVCNDRPSIYTDTASHSQLIHDAATTAGHPLAAAPAADQSDPTSRSDSTDPAAADESDPSDTTKSTKKYGSGFVAQQNAGCAMTRTSSTPSRGLFLGLIAIGVMALRRRSRAS